MRLAIVARVTPSRSVGGMAQTLWALADEARRRGHQVTYVYLNEGPLPDPSWIEVARSELSLEVTVLSVRRREFGRSPLRRVSHLVHPSLVDIYPWVDMRGTVGALLASRNPDAVFAYETLPASAIPSIFSSRGVVAFVDLDHLPARYRRSVIPRRVDFKTRILNVRDALWRPTLMLRILDEFKAVVNFAAHHAAWLNRRGLTCTYLPTPVPDPMHHHRTASGTPPASPSRRGPSEPFRILLVGHLRGTATLLGLRVLGKGIIPQLARAAPAPFEIRIVGAEAEFLPEDLRMILRKAPVVFPGFVDDIGAEFASADVLLVPTPLRIGTRVRIIDGLAFGSCIVAHRANAAGIPELVHGMNCLLAPDASGLVSMLIRVMENPAERSRLARQARETYDAHFSSANERLLNLLEAVGAGGVHL